VIEKTVLFNKKFLLRLSIISTCFLLDRLSKTYIINFFENSNLAERYINPYLNFTLLWNEGIAFGLLQADNFFYHLITFIILIVIIYIFYLNMKTRLINEAICYSIIIGGAIGNFLDRIVYNAVPDFIDLHYGDFHWFVFNISDVCITAGILLLLFFDIIKFKKYAGK